MSTKNRYRNCFASHLRKRVSYFLPEFYLTEDRYVVHVVIISQRLDEPIAEATLPAAHRTLLLLPARQPHNGHGQKLARTGAGCVRVAPPQSQTACCSTHPAKCGAPTTLVSAPAQVRWYGGIHLVLNGTRELFKM